MTDTLGTSLNDCRSVTSVVLSESPSEPMESPRGEVGIDIVPIE